MNETLELSVIIPVYNEEESIMPLIGRLETALAGIEKEIIFVDDGSTDKTAKIIRSVMKPNWQLISFRRNYGQSSAMGAGLAAARGKYVATMDGDLQNDPEDIPLMIKQLEAENSDVVVGWRQKRKDGFILRKIPSMIANKLIRRMTGVYVHDYGCTLKVFTQETTKLVDLYGELHRFIPVLANITGARISEMKVRHHARQFGSSKYGLSRTFRVISDLLLMFFLQKYRQKPMHLFGMLGAGSFFIGGGILFYLLIVKIMGQDIGTRPLFFVGILLLITSVQLITTGFISELLMRTYFESQQKKPYVIRTHYIGQEEQPK